VPERVEDVEDVEGAEGEEGVDAEEYVWLVNWMVRLYARRLQVSSADLDDLRGDALLALVGAAKRWKPSGGATFKTYAGKRVQGAIRDWTRSRLGSKTRAGFDVPKLMELSRNMPTALRHATPSTSLQDMVSEESVDRMLGILDTDTERRIVLMYVFQALSFREIGRILGMSTTKAWGRWRGVRRKLHAHCTASLKGGRR